MKLLMLVMDKDYLVRLLDMPGKDKEVILTNGIPSGSYEIIK
jgi:hypothetical protein